MLPRAIVYTTIYCLLGELGAAGLRAPPECVVDPQPDLDNASEGNAVMTATLQQRSMRHPPSFACMSDLLCLPILEVRMSLETRSTTAETAKQRLSERLRERVLPLWQRQLEHPFVVALGNGSLPQTNFEFYIRQDALFLDELTKTFAYAITKTTDHEEMEQFGKFLLSTLLVEADIHRHYGEQFGLTPDEMAATEMAPTTYAYTRHLLSIAATGTLPELLTAMLPCAWIYAEVGRHLVGNTPPPSSHPYANWLVTYASPDFDAVGLWIRERLDVRATSLSPEEEARLHEIFLISTRYEWLFWEMAWHLEEWPL
jgi:thiaminase (transcriptional activator TenA)